MSSTGSDSTPSSAPAAAASHPNGGRQAAVLAWAFGLSMLLALALQCVMAFEVDRARQEVEDLFRLGNRTNQLMGRLGLGVSRQRSLALEMLTDLPAGTADDDPQLAHTGALLERLNRDLDEACHELGGLIGPREGPRWRAFLPQLDRMRVSLGAAFSAIEAGRFEAAEQILDDVAVQSRRVQDALATLAQENSERSELLRAAADDRLADVWRLQLALAAALVTVLGGIGAGTSRLLRRQRRQLDAYVERVEGINRELDQFAGRVAHDLKNVLNPLSIASGLLERRPGPDAVARVSGLLGNTSRRANDLIEALLAFSRAGQPIVSGVADAQPVVDDALAVCEGRARELGATCVAQVEPAWIACDRALLTQVLDNLLDNALKHLAGRPERRVRVAGRVVAAAYELEVEDTGPGVPPEAVARLFDPFYRAPGAQGPGLGIGLATVQRIVAAHGGSVTYAPRRPRAGARFLVTLPLALERQRATQGAVVTP